MGTPLRVLIIDDSGDDTQLILRELKKGGFDPISRRVDTPEGMLAALQEETWQIVIADYSMPNFNGLAAFSLLKESFNEKGWEIPFLLVSGAVGEELAVDAMRLGVNDYLMKSNLKRLVPSVQRELREEQVHREKKRLEKAKEEFVATVSHELRTPMSIIRESISLVHDEFAGPISERQKEFLTNALKNMDYLNGMIDELLDVSKIEAGKIVLARRLVDVTKLVRGVISDFKKQATDKKLEVREKFPEKRVLLYLDPARVRQVFLNLIGNALKFTERGCVEVSMVDREKELECSVADTGPGIPREDLPLLFEKFQQFRRTAGPGEKGAGLGLAICKGLVERHGGKIWAESELGKGFKLIFTLPKLTLEEVVKESLSQSLGMSARAQAHLLLLVIKIRNLNEIQGKLSREEFSRMLWDLEERINQSLRQGADGVFNMGGEFFVILPNTERQKSFAMIGRIRQIFDDSLRERGLSSLLELVSEVVSFPEEGKTAEVLLEKARAKLGRKKKILIVDDEREFVELLMQRLGVTNQFEWVYARSGAEALQIVSEDIPDAIICDLKLPDINGDEVVERMKNNEKTKNIPVIVLTAYKVERGEDTSVSLGSLPIVSKSEGLDKVIETLRGFL